MSVWILLLRAVNVGGTGRLPMATLKAILGDLGATDVATYIQSGNAVFRSGPRPRCAGRRDRDGRSRRRKGSAPISTC